MRCRLEAEEGAGPVMGMDIFFPSATAAGGYFMLCSFKAQFSISMESMKHSKSPDCPHMLLGLKHATLHPSRKPTMGAVTSTTVREKALHRTLAKASNILPMLVTVWTNPEPLPMGSEACTKDAFAMQPAKEQIYARSCYHVEIWLASSAMVVKLRAGVVRGFHGGRGGAGKPVGGVSPGNVDAATKSYSSYNCRTA